MATTPPMPSPRKNISEKRFGSIRNSRSVGRCCHTLNHAPTAHKVFSQRLHCVKRHGKPPNLGEAVLAKGAYYYYCLKDYDKAVRYFEQARQLLPNSGRIPELLGYVARRQGQWDRSDSYFNEAEKLDPRNVYVLTQHATTNISRRRFPEALQKLEQVLNITPDDVDAL